MKRSAAWKRKSFLVEERTLQRAKKLLGASTESEAVRLCLERVAEMEAFWREMKATRRSLRPGSFEET